MNRRLASTIALAATALSLAAPVSALEGVPKNPNADAQITSETTTLPMEFQVTGVLEYRDIEGGYYAVGEWALLGDNELFKANLGKQVVLYGKPFDGMTIMVAKAFEVRELVVSEPVVQGDKVILSGTVEWVDLEGGYYAMDGYALLGDEKYLAALVGQKAIIHGTKDTEPSILMVDRVNVELVVREVGAQHAAPKQLSFGGKAIKFDQGFEKVDGTLMVPLRAVVEAAGGWVEWDAKERAVHVEMSDRQAFFWVGQEKAEMNQNNVRYLTRNLIAMDKAPVIMNGRVMISADAITQILGLYEQFGTVEGEMNLVSAN